MAGPIPGSGTPRPLGDEERESPPGAAAGRPATTPVPKARKPANKAGHDLSGFSSPTFSLTQVQHKNFAGVFIPFSKQA